MLPRELIKKIRRIEIVTARQAQNQLAGAYHSVFKGLGMAFSEVRQYQPGDDVRMIDWNVTARMREAYVKLFVEEREMTVMLLVDASGSGAFGTREQAKREVAAEIAALLAFSAIKNNDRIGLIIFTDRVEKIKGSSSDILPDLGIAGRRFELAYIDGSHRAADVYRDAALTWPLMAPDGIVVFDDYEWSTVETDEESPKLGVDAFLAAHGGQYRELARGYQVAIQKV